MTTQRGINLCHYKKKSAIYTISTELIISNTVMYEAQYLNLTASPNLTTKDNVFLVSENISKIKRIMQIIKNSKLLLF
jgi:hypothetical protein